MGPSNDDTEYLLLVKDTESSFCWLFPFSEADGPNATCGILQWFSTFGGVPTWCSDQGSNFKNKLMDAGNKTLHCIHRFSAPNAPKPMGQSKEFV